MTNPDQPADPWRDPERYRSDVACVGCGEPGGSPWGPWCHPCNTVRMERLDRQFAALDALFRARQESASRAVRRPEFGQHAGDGGEVRGNAAAPRRAPRQGPKEDGR